MIGIVVVSSSESEDECPDSALASSSAGLASLCAPSSSSSAMGDVTFPLVRLESCRV